MHTNQARAERSRGQLKCAALLLAGLLTALLAVIPPLAPWAGQYIWVRAMQDLLLCFAAPMMIASGSPRVDGPPRDTAWSRASPVAAAVAFNVSCLVWHLPAFFDAARANTAVQFTEYTVYLVTASWFWLQILRPRPGAWQSPLRRLALLTATLAVWTVVGMALVFGSNVFYPAYVNSLHHAMTVLDDQQLSGGVLWMGMMPFLVTAGIILLAAWLNDEDSVSPTDAEIPIRKRTWGWAARSWLR